MSNNTEIETLKKRISELEEKLSMYESNGLAKAYNAINFQLNNLSAKLLESTISFDEKDRQFERFWTFSKEVGMVRNNLEVMKKVMFPEEDKKDDTDNSSFMDRMANKEDK